MIVVDTNVMVYLLAGGPRGAAAADLLRQDPDWAGPPILLSELRNVLAGSVGRELVTEEDALAMLDDARGILGGRVVTVTGSEALRIALRRGLTAYDAEFVVLAQALDVPLVTADRAILAAASEVAVPL